MLPQLEGGEEQWVPDPQDVEGRDIRKVTYAGEDLEIPMRMSSLRVSNQNVESFGFPKARLGAEGMEVRLCGFGLQPAAVRPCYLRCYG